MARAATASAVRRWRGWARKLRRMGGDEEGVAAIEFAVIAGVLAIVMLNAFDIARYHYERMQVENATQMAAQSVWQACDTSHLPATTKCSGLTSAITTALQTTPLGSAVQLKSGSPAEGYYCINASNALVHVGDTSSKPANCGSVGNASGQAGDYIKIETTYSFVPLFPGIGVGGMLPSQITSSAMMRLQ